MNQNLTQPNLKLLLKPGDEDEGEGTALKFSLREHVEVPYFTYVRVGLDKMYFKTPGLFTPDSQFNGNITITHATQPGGETYEGSCSSEDFKSLTLSDVNRSIDLRNISYQEDATQLMDILDGFKTGLDEVFASIDPGYSWSTDFYCYDFFQPWTYMNEQQRIESCQQYIMGGYRGLQMFVRRVETTYEASIQIQGSIVSELFGHTTNTISFLFDYDETTPCSSYLDVNIQWQGMKYLRVNLSQTSSFRIGDNAGPGLSRSPLLSVVPVLGLPGSTEYYVNTSEHDKLMRTDHYVNEYLIIITDQDGNILQNLEDWYVILGIDFVNKEERERGPTMKRTRDALENL